MRCREMRCNSSLSCSLVVTLLDSIADNPMIQLTIRVLNVMCDIA